MAKIYDMGKPYPQVIWESILDLHNNGLSIRQRSAQARVSTGFITKVVKEYNENNYSVPRRALSGRNMSVLTENVRSYLVMRYKGDYCWMVSVYQAKYCQMHQ